MRQSFANRLGWVGLLVVAQAHITGASVPPPTEYEVKAAFLLNFARFVEWPDDARRQGPVVICVAGKDPFGPTLDRIISGRQANGRPVEIRRSPSLEQMRRCHILFVGLPGRDSTRILAEVDRSGALTVGDSDNFARIGGMIGFSVEDDHVRLDINLEAANRAQLKVSSQLLRVARVVSGAPAR